MMTQTCKIDSQGKVTLPPITANIANLGLPVGEWKQLAKEIEEGRIKRVIHRFFEIS